MVLETTGLQTHIWNNNIRSIALLAIYPVLILSIIWFCSAIIGMQMTNTTDWNQGIRLANSLIYQYWPIILAIVSVWFAISYFFHTNMIRSMANSHPVTRKEEPALYNLLENMCISQGMKTPKLEIIESHARNAFASGINEKTFSITVTRGLLQSLSKDEVEGVLAHELTHIQNRDVRLLIITIIFTGMLGFAAQVVWRNLRYSLWVPKGGKNKGGGFAILMILVLILWLGYFATLFTRFALTRRREYMADAGAVQITKNPEAMMRALMRINGRDQIPKIPADITMMCVENHVPFMGLFATHPPIKKRIISLSETTRTTIPKLPQLIAFSAPPALKKDQFSPWKNNRTNWTIRQRFKERKKANPWQKTQKNYK